MDRRRLGPGAELRGFSVIIRFKNAAGVEGAARKVCAYASVIDEATGDATLIPAVPLD